MITVELHTLAMGEVTVTPPLLRRLLGARTRTFDVRRVEAVGFAYHVWVDWSTGRQVAEDVRVAIEREVDEQRRVLRAR